MSLEIKYRVREVGKDFALNGKAVGNKKVTEILTKYAKTPTSAMAVLNDQELSIIFDYLTQTNQIGSLEEVYAETYQEPGKAPEAKSGAQKPQQGQKTQPKQGGKPAGQRNDRNDRNQRQGGKTQQQPARQQNAQSGKQSAEQKQAPAQKAQPNKQQPAAGQKQQPAEQQQSAQQQPASRVPQKKVVNTRKNVNVNLDRYDSRLDDLTPERAERMQQGKQKISSRRQQQQKQGKQSAKRRQEEQQQRMRRLQQEAARKAPVKVEIPDEITVGELASRMKKTGAEVVKRLMMNGVMASMSDTIDFDTAAFVAEELGCKVEKEVVVTIEEKLIDTT
ncbi:MAG: translation initiation factor IF-2 N-terminal domain-containing protein, partial [Clostridiales bacterium]|nr:translation initiation factor IF-2 N-terminal domain-containing protein [Clostridiales bacterium]